MNTVNPSGFVSSTASTSVSGSAVSTLRAISRVSCFSLSCVAAKMFLLLTENGPAGPFRNCSKCGETIVASGGRNRRVRFGSRVEDDRPLRTLETGGLLLECGRSVSVPAHDLHLALDTPRRHGLWSELVGS